MLIFNKLKNAFRAGKTSNSPTFFDFKPYAPSNDAPASFMSTKVKNDAGEAIGVLVFQMPVAKINALMGQTDGLGETGETYFVGTDLLMRSNSRFSEEDTVLALKVDTPAVQKALSGERGIDIEQDYRRIHTVSAYAPLEFMGANWAMIAQQDTRETFAPIDALKMAILIQLSIAALFLGLIGWLVSRSFAKPVKSLGELMCP